MARIPSPYDGDATPRSGWSAAAGAAGTRASTASAGTSLRASMTLQRSLRAKVTHPREVLGAHGEGLPKLGGDLLEELLAIGRVGEHGDRVVQARQRGDHRRDSQQLDGQPEAARPDVVPGGLDPRVAHVRPDCQQAESDEEDADREADDEDLKALR